MAAPNSVVSEHPLYGGQGPTYVGTATGSVGFYQDPFGATFVGFIVGTTLTVVTMSTGVVAVGGTLTAVGIVAGTTITALGTGTGGAGTYTVSTSQTLALTTITIAAAAVPQPSGPAQAAMTRGQPAGVITTYASNNLSPAAVAQITCATQTLTPLTGTGPTMNLASGDVLIVNKPTSQAGLGVGNTFVNGAGTVSMNFSNIPAGGNITPTATQSYTFVALRGLGNFKLTATLSPASVPANSSIEQTFTVTGAQVGWLLQVSKPTNQAGLDIGGIRVVSNNLVGITFINPTAAAIVPTAAEVYTFVALPGLDAVNNDVLYGMNVGTVGAIGPGVVVSGGSTTLTGVLATDVVAGVMKPTVQAAATNAAIPFSGIPTADTMTLSFFGVGAGYTPTGSEIYSIATKRIAPVAPLVVFTQTLTPVSVAALTTAEQTFTISSPNALVAASPVWVNKITSATPGLAIVGVRISAANTLAINFANLTTTAIVPPAEPYLIGNFQVPTPGVGNSVYQTVCPAIHNVENLAGSIRNALAPLTGVNLIAGA